MEKLLVLALAGACASAGAQTPSANPMPDGSRDMYVGLGAVSTPRYEGAQARHVAALPVLQVEWSNGMFVSGMSAGMHWSNQPVLEYGPLLAVQPRRSESGVDSGLGGVSGANSPALAPPLNTGIVPPRATPVRFNRLYGMDEIGARLLAGGFLNYYLTPQLRLTGELLYGAGNAHNGARLKLGVQKVATGLAPHHTLALTAGLTLVNQDENQAFFGVSKPEAERSFNPAYTASGGVKDVYLGARWNWALTPGWMLSSGLQLARLRGSAASSPLVERSGSVTVSSALAYRF
ncbi:MAG: MipA/OmpV family protein [Pseudomonadota bacterium]